MKTTNAITRRKFITIAAAVSAGITLPFSHTVSASTPILKKIVKTGEEIPVIGMGTSRTFDAMGNTEMLAKLELVMQTFFDMGGGMIDSSPMYGSSEKVIGHLLKQVSGDKNLFSATKVWINGKDEGIEQMEQSRMKWAVDVFDLMQIHNLVDWKTHLKTLNKMKSEGKIRYVGITTSHGRYHDELQDILKKHDFDFLQLSYNIANRDVEQNLLPIALDRGISVIVNRPYQRGHLFMQVKGKQLPPWAQEFDCNSWGQYFLKYIVSHPAVTCAIPATTKEKHMQDNMMAGKGRLPTLNQRDQMLKYFESL